MQAYNKLWASLLVPVILTLAGAVGVTPEMPFAEAIGILITAFFVWLVPNKT